MHNKLVAYKSNALIEAQYALTLQEQRLLLVCIGKLDPHGQIPSKTVSVTANEFFLYFPDMGRKNSDSLLKEAANNLWERTIVIKDKSKIKKFRWIQEQIDYIDGSGRIEVTFSVQVLPYLTQLKEQFTKVAIKNVSRLTRTCSMRLYELLQQFLPFGNRLIKLENFRSFLALENKYPDFKMLNFWVISPALKELNSKTNLCVSVKKIKDGNRVIALHFFFEEKSSIIEIKS